MKMEPVDVKNDGMPTGKEYLAIFKQQAKDRKNQKNTQEKKNFQKKYKKPSDLQPDTYYEFKMQAQYLREM